MSNLERTLRELTLKILNQQPESTDLTIKISPGSTRGDNYLSQIYRIEVEPIGKKYIAKIAVQNEETRNFMSARGFFIAEVHFYNTVLPAFLDFQRERGFLNFNHVARCLATSLEEKSEMLIFEDLKECGFDLWDRKLPMPEEYILEVLRLYGRFHAVSFALRNQDEKKFQEIASESLDAWEIAFENCSKKSREGLGNILGSHLEFFEKYETVDLVEKYRNFVENWEKYSIATGDKSDKKMVFIHGDCWCNNMMFKKSFDGKLEVRLLDFQLERLGSPAVDILYFFLSSATGEMLKNFDFFIKTYYESFSEHLKNLGSDPEITFSFTDLQQHIRKYGKVALISSVIITKLLYLEDDEVLEFNENNLEGFSEEIKNQNIVSRRIVDLVKVAIENGIL